MFNLLRMDLYRLKRSTSVYVCLAIMLAFIALSYWMVWLVSTPEGQAALTSAAASNKGLTITSKEEILEEDAHLLEGYDSLMMIRDAGMNGGMYLTMFSIAVVLFVCGDFKNGFMKNILSLHRERWHYIGSKLIVMGILNFCWLAVQCLWNTLLNLMFHTLVPFSSWQDILFYHAWAWLLTTAFAALLILVCVLTRSSAAGILTGILLGSGLVVQFIAYLTSLFDFYAWLDYSIYWNLAYGPSSYTRIGDLWCFGVGAAFLVIYALGASLILRKQDI